MELAITLLRLLAAAFSGAFGVLGLLTNYRDEKTKRITRWGRIALVGIVVSTAVALLTQGLEHWREQNKSISAAIEARDASRRAEATLNNINRLLQPLKDIKVGFTFKIADDDPRLVRYLKFLRDKFDEAARNFAATGNANQPNGIMVIAELETRRIDSFDIWPTSPLLASDRAGVLELVALNLDWYATAQYPRAAANAKAEPDLRLNVIATDYGKDPRLHTQYEPKSNKFLLSGIFPKASVEADKGVIRSVLDVPGSTIVIRLLNKHPLTLENLTISVAEGQNFKITKFQHFIVDDLDTYVYIFPKDTKPR